MKQIRVFGDERQTSMCIHCGGSTETKDHVPSKVFLDKPYPPNLPVTPCCKPCNEGFSLDEEYVACLVECARTGGPEAVERQKIVRILEESPALAARIREESSVDNGHMTVRAEVQRVEKVVMKLARCISVYELHEPQLGDPTVIGTRPIHEFTRDERSEFETPPWAGIYPEVGSRGMQRMARTGSMTASWIEVQSGRFRYLACVGPGVLIRMVLSEYLACEVLWSDELPGDEW